MKFKAHGLLAIAPSALDADFDEDFATAAQTINRGMIAIIPIRGPLKHHADAKFDSYEEIKARTYLALKAGARDIIWRLDSPGGLVSGCFDVVTEVRQMMADAGARLTAYCEQASSASYALACAASRVIASASASVGSIGVIETVTDATAAAESAGVKVVLVTSGARKADGNPMSAITEASIAASQSNVDAMAGLFFDLVAQSRGLSVETIKRLEAAQMPGTVAHAIGLVDEIATFDQAFAMVASGVAAATATESKEMAATAKEMIAALKAKAESKDDDAQEARAALAEFKEDDKEAEGSDDDDKKAEGSDDDAKETEESDDTKEAEGSDDDDKKAQAFGAKEASAIFRKEYQMIQDNATRDGLIAKRPDLAASTVLFLKKQKLADVREYLKGVPVVASPAQAAILGAKTQATAAAGSLTAGALGATTFSAHAATLDQEMGLTPAGGGTRFEGNKLILGRAAAKVTK